MSPDCGEARLIVVSEAPAQYHIDIFRKLYGILKDRFIVVYRSPGQAQGASYESWGEKNVIKNDSGLLSGYPYRILDTSSRRELHAFFSKSLGVSRGDTVLFHTILPEFSRRSALVCKLLGATLLFRGSSHLSVYKPKWQNRLRRARDIVTLGLFDGFCATGSVTWRYFEQNTWGKKIIFSPYCVDEYVIDTYKQNYGALRAARRRELEVTEDEMLVVYLGRFIALKNIERLLRAYRRVDGGRIRLVLGGDGPLREQLLAMIERDSWTNPPKYLGLLDRKGVGELLCASDALALPSFTETWAVVVNEAMHLDNVAMVTKGVGCAADLVWEGENGTYVCPYDEREIAAGLERLLAIWQNGRFRTLNKDLMQTFSADNAVAGILEAIHFRPVSQVRKPPGLKRGVTDL